MSVLYEAYFVTSKPVMDELLQRIGNELQLPQTKRKRQVRPMMQFSISLIAMKIYFRGTISMSFRKAPTK